MWQDYIGNLKEIWRRRFRKSRHML